jgi:hypothetical protein
MATAVADTGSIRKLLASSESRHEPPQKSSAILAAVLGRMRWGIRSPFSDSGSVGSTSTGEASSSCARRFEPWLLAFIVAEPREHGVPAINTDTEKHLVLAAVNLVECNAETTGPSVD